MATEDEIKVWFGPGIEVIVLYPIRTQPYYRARVPEFGFEARSLRSQGSEVGGCSATESAD